MSVPHFQKTISTKSQVLSEYNITLRHPDLPVVDVGAGQKSNYLPPELCEIEDGLPFPGRLGDRETAAMIKVACNPPAVNAEAIVYKGLPALFNTPNAPFSPVDGFGISVVPEMTVIPGRELPPPKLSYRNKAITAQNGSWNIMDVKFHQGATVNSWWVLVVRDQGEILQGPQDSRLKELVTNFAKKCSSSGINIPPGLPHLISSPVLVPVSEDPTRVRAVQQLKQLLLGELQGRPKPSFILVLLSKVDNFIYPGMKRLGDVELGIHTVHMQLSKALNEPRKQDQYLSNIAIKVNTKLGGINHKLDDTEMKWLSKAPTMIVGIDVRVGCTSVR